MKIYLLYTGGTIGCVGKPLAPMDSQSFTAAFQQWIEPTIASQMPDVTIGKYDFLDKPLNSAEIQPSDWLTIAQKILENYNDYDAFLILHGTDTMAWTASALSFLLPRGLKPIVCTGAQLPMFYRPLEGGACSLRYQHRRHPQRARRRPVSDLQGAGSLRLFRRPSLSRQSRDQESLDAVCRFFVAELSRARRPRRRADAA